VCTVPFNRSIGPVAIAKARHRARRYLSRISFLTDFTLLTLRATLTALYMSAWYLTKPLSWTVPLKVSTLISADFSEGSLNIAAFTLVVMTVSSMYSPVPSLVEVAAQPRTVASRTARKTAEMLLSYFTIRLSIECRIWTGGDTRGTKSRHANCPDNHLFP
jgi:hypothetical protein